MDRHVSYSPVQDNETRRPKRVGRIRIRWLILGFLIAFTMAAYVQRTAISVAAEPIMPALGLSQLQIGWLETAFLISYTALQFPGGVLGQVLGARVMFTLCGVVGLAATLAVPILPSVARGTWLFVSMLTAQFVLGATQAPFFAVLTGALERWFPSRQWALTQGLTSCGIGLGSAAAPALIASLTVLAGWRAALIVSALLVVPLIALWWIFGRNEPVQHAQVSQQELRELDPPANAREAENIWRRMRSLLLDWNLAGLTLSYLAMNFVFYLITFWSFLYLVQARHLTVLQSGWAATLPPLAGAVGAGLGGVCGSFCCVRLGPRRGLRVVPLITLPSSGALLILSVHAPDAFWALAGLSLSFGLLEMNEAIFWTSAMEIGRADAVAAGGLLNTGGNLGGIIATPIVALLSNHGDWTAPFLAGAVFAGISTCLWLLIDPASAASRQLSLQEHAAGETAP
jgi:ACS family glucarate transporter-like MFS transporter